MRREWMPPLVLLAAAVLPHEGRCQTPPAFEVASVRLSPPGAKPQLRRDPAGGITGASIDLRMLVRLAFNIEDFQLINLPAGIGADRYDVIAKAPAGVKKEQTWVMLQALLADRFKLETHKEERELTMYALTVSKNGFKLQPSTNPPGEADDSVKFAPGHITCIKVPMADLALALSGVAGHRVIDRTGISGKYDVKLGWAARLKADPADGAATEPEGPSLFTAVEEQLGLKLVAEKGPVEVVVVDHVERASSN